MIRITAELYPKGKAEGRRVLGVIVIANDGTGGSHSGNYDVWACLRTMRSRRQGRVTNFPRASRHVWRLVFKALKDLYEKSGKESKQ